MTDRATNPATPIDAIRLANELLAAGQLAAGFKLLQRQREIPERRVALAPALPLPRLLNRDVSGKRILIWSEEGYGDQIMYARFARALVESGASVVWMCPPPLANLFREGLGVEVLLTTESVTLNGIDFYCPSSALPLAFELTPETIPPAPYLVAPPRPTGRRLGVVSSGNPKHDNDVNRSLDPANAARLLDLPDAMSLQPWDTGATEFYATAQIISGLELVISVDTAIAHLAGALGKPVWILLPAQGTDWRWMMDRSDSPWYASAQLFHQITPGDWTPVLDAVERSLLSGRRD